MQFADVRGKYGTIDYEDLMDFTDHILAQYSDIDASRVGVTGGSYGGIMTNWIIGHTQRFAAAVSCRSVANFVSDFGQSEISYDDDLALDSKPLGRAGAFVEGIGCAVSFRLQNAYSTFAFHR